jgi:hypothetical protein
MVGSRPRLSLNSDVVSCEMRPSGPVLYRDPTGAARYPGCFTHTEDLTVSTTKAGGRSSKPGRKTNCRVGATHRLHTVQLRLRCLRSLLFKSGFGPGMTSLESLSATAKSRSSWCRLRTGPPLKTQGIGERLKAHWLAHPASSVHTTGSRGTACTPQSMGDPGDSNYAGL